MGYSGGRGGQKPSKTYLMYGDSFSLGGKVNDSQTFAYIVEHKQKIRIVNFSVPGFGTDQQRLLYQETSMWIDADGYIFSISIESIIRNIQRYRPSWKGREAYGLYFRAKPYYLITNDHLVLQGVPVPGNRFRRNELVKTDYPLFNTSCAYKDDRYSAWTLMKMILSELIAEIPKQKKIVLLLLPDEDYYINNVTAHYRSRFTEFASNYQNVIIIDALDSFLGYRTSERKKLFFPYDHHYTPLGHRVIASFLKAIL